MKTFKTLLICTALLGASVAPLESQSSDVASAEKPAPPPPAIERLVSPDRPIRVAAKDEILAAHNELVDNLIAIVKKKRMSYVRDDEKFLAVQLLGALRAVDAVETLLENITFRPPQTIHELVPQAIYPCVGALIEIGRPAAKGVMKRLDREQSEDRPSKPWLYAIIVRDVEGHVAGRAILEDELNSRRTPPGSVKEANIREMLKYFEE